MVSILEPFPARFRKKMDKKWKWVAKGRQKCGKGRSENRCDNRCRKGAEKERPNDQKVRIFMTCGSQSGIDFTIFSEMPKVVNSLHRAYRERVLAFQKVSFFSPFVFHFHVFLDSAPKFSYFLGMCFPGAISLRVSVDSWTPGGAKTMQNYWRVSQNQGFTNSGKVCF